jgi:sterol desaturase/sphingolipid hydroxylase (fatty acid hydroxylase superfamily)
MIWHHPVWVAFLAAAFALVEGSLSEYWIHRSMHRRGWARRRHGEHHMAGTGQGWAGEFRDYVSPALPFCVLASIPSLAIGIGFSAGAILYFAFAAYSHQVQHERPELVFWMKAPVHHLHHRHHMTRYNYGIGVDIWDRWFGTYQFRQWQQKERPRDLREWFRIQWGSRPATEEQIREESGWRSEPGISRPCGNATGERKFGATRRAGSGRAAS